MSDTLRPWLADAVSSYQRMHGRNLTFPKKGRLLQITQYNNYRNTNLPADKEKDVFAWAHDKAYEVLLRFEASAVNAFEDTHESFTSYRYGLFHLLEYKFVLGTDYISEEPRSSTHVRTFPDLPKPRIFYLQVTKFTYISSKGEGNFASRAVRPLEQKTRNWKLDIEEDEEKKRGLVMQVTASQLHTHDAPPRLEDMQAAAESMKAKKQTKPLNGSQQRSPKRLKLSRSLNLNNMLPIPLEVLLSSMPAPKTPQSDLIGEELVIPPTAHDASQAAAADLPGRTEDLQDVLPSTPPPPPTSANSARTLVTVTSVPSTAVRQLSVKHTSVQITSSPTANRAYAPTVGLGNITYGQENNENNENTVYTNNEANQILKLPDATDGEALHTSEAALRAAALDDAIAAAEAEVAEIGPMPELDLPAIVQTEGTVSSQQATRTHIGTSTPTKKSKKAVKLPRYPLDGEEEEKEAVPPTQLQLESSVSPDKQHGHTAEPAPSKLVDVDFFRDLASSPAAKQKSLSPHALEREAVKAGSFYGRNKPLFNPASSPPPGSAEPANMTAEIETPVEVVMSGSDNVLLASSEEAKYDDKKSASTRPPPSEASSDGFEFVSFHEGPGTPFVPVKVEDRGLAGADIADAGAADPSPMDFACAPVSDTSTSSDTSAMSQSANLTLQLENVSQQEIDGLLKTVKAFTKRARSCSSAESRGRSLLGQSARSELVTRTASNVQSKVDHSATKASTAQPILITGSDSTLANLSKAKRSVSGPVRARPSADDLDTSMSMSMKRRRISDFQERSTHSTSPHSLLSNGLRASRSSQQSVEARKAIAERMEGIKSMLESRGLTRRQGIDLWYCCSGNFEVAAQIADNSIDLIESLQNANRTKHVMLNKGSRAGKDLYKHCWTFEDDQVVENPTPEVFQIARRLQEIEARRGKGSIAARRRFLSQDPLASKLIRKVRYPYDEDET
ncbi:hypothetical protein P389DRAFT_209202 [Cystobasidium minutum MCA 4210]|uniref:uncharacterized protein n=1 Tax=Cystobasidium minutum MCA 4210 TaxID=1397322 RepID=UPI0034CF9427|eukprot:jgi/Rhomi1/209202/estExt_Genemark1.C_2_t30024